MGDRRIAGGRRPPAASGSCRVCGDSGSIPEFDRQSGSWQSGDTPCPCQRRWCPDCGSVRDPDDGFCAACNEYPTQ